MVLLGASHRQLAWAAYALMLVCAALAFTLRVLPQYTAWLLALLGGIYLLIFLAIDRRWRIARNEH